MAHSYASSYPSGLSVDDGIVQFFKDFYSTSDNPNAHEQYPDMFTDDATFILASKTSHGHDEILKTRLGMWSAVSSRKHTVAKVFPFGSDAHEYMLYGIVNFSFKAGGDAQVDWAARATLTQVNGKWKMNFYQVYLDTGAVGPPKK